MKKIQQLLNTVEQSSEDEESEELILVRQPPKPKPKTKKQSYVYVVDNGEKSKPTPKQYLLEKDDPKPKWMEKYPVEKKKRKTPVKKQKRETYDEYVDNFEQNDYYEQPIQQDPRILEMNRVSNLLFN